MSAKRFAEKRQKLCRSNQRLPLGACPQASSVSSSVAFFRADLRRRNRFALILRAVFAGSIWKQEKGLGSQATPRPVHSRRQSRRRKGFSQFCVLAEIGVVIQRFFENRGCDCLFHRKHKRMLGVVAFFRLCRGKQSLWLSAGRRRQERAAARTHFLLRKPR